MIGEFLRYTVFGLAFAGVYFIAASGLVVTYTASGIFNFAHGAVAMIAAFTYWDLRVEHHWAAPAAFAAVLLVEAPLMGLVIERVVMRNLGGAATITNIVVTIGLLVTLLGVGSVVWAPSKFAATPSLPRFYAANVVNIAGAPIPWHYFIVLAISAGAAFGLWTLLAGTRLGIAMRAVVDDRNLVRLNGGDPNIASAASWIVGCMLAALAGILIAPILALDVARLTLLVISAYAVAVVGRLRSLPLTALGAVILGLVLSYFDWGLSKMQHVPVWVQSVHDSLPIIMLFVVLLVLPQDRTRLTTTVSSRGTVAVPTMRTAVLGGITFVAGAWVVEALLHGAVLRAAGQGLAIAIIMLSLVLLTGYAGQISLAQLAFAGLGVLAASWLPVELGASPVGLLVAAGFAGLVGAVIAIPCLRLRDLYLALGTMAFALVVEQNVLGQIAGFATDSKTFTRWAPIAGDKAYFVAIAFVFSVLACLVIALRRSEFGRRLQAMKDSPAASTTVGLDLTRTKVEVFALAAAIAAVGGFMLAGWKGTVGKDDFSLLTGTLSALPVLLLAVVGGITVVSGAMIGALTLVAIPQIAADYPSLRNIMILLPGLVGISLARNPDGLASDLRNVLRDARAAARARAEGRAPRAMRRLRHPSSRSSSAWVVAFPTRTGAPLASWASVLRSAVTLFEARGLTVRFGGHNAVTDVDLDVERGCVTGLIGPNGAGKTTIFNAITGLQDLSDGTLTLEGRDITHEAPPARARLGMARTFQQLEVFGSLSTRENILVAAEIRRRWAHDLESNPLDDAEAILDRVGLRNVADERADALPTGLARLCELGRALATRPRLLLLDEPASGLSDIETEMFAELLHSLTADGISVLLVEHDVGLVMEVCASIHVIDYGALVAVGTPAEIRSNPAVLDAYLGDGSAKPQATSTRTRASDSGDPGDARAAPVLELRNITAAYGKIEVLHGINIVLPRGKVVALLGPNGSGKSTTLKVASGQMQPSSGCIHLGGRHVNGAAGQALSRIGLCTIPEGRGVFPNLTVRENLMMASYVGLPLKLIEERTYAFFPRLERRRSQLAGTLSGGEQRMLAMARALATEPAVLLLDEMSMGLAPLIVEELYGLVGDIAGSGISILVVEQFAHIVLGVADLAIVMVQGKIALAGQPADIETELTSAYLGANL